MPPGSTSKPPPGRSTASSSKASAAAARPICRASRPSSPISPLRPSSAPRRPVRSPTAAVAPADDVDGPKSALYERFSAHQQLGAGGVGDFAEGGVGGGAGRSQWAGDPPDRDFAFAEERADAAGAAQPTRLGG